MKEDESKKPKLNVICIYLRHITFSFLLIYGPLGSLDLYIYYGPLRSMDMALLDLWIYGHIGSMDIYIYIWLSMDLHVYIYRKHAHFVIFIVHYDL
jgi:hypothetical protein